MEFILPEGVGSLRGLFIEETRVLAKICTFMEKSRSVWRKGDTAGICALLWYKGGICNLLCYKGRMLHVAVLSANEGPLFH